MSAGAFKRSARNRTTVSTWERGYRGRFVVRRDWPAILTGWAWGLGSAAWLLGLVVLMENGAWR